MSKDGSGVGRWRAARRSAALVATAFALTATYAAAQEREKRPPDTDKTVPVARDSRLTVSNYAGEVVIHTWDRDQLRVQARHPARAQIDIQTAGTAVSIRSRGGPQGAVDYDITAPVWLPVKVSGQFLYIGIEGAQNEVSAETVRGDIVVKGGSGFVTAKSIEGEVIVEDAKGKISVSSVNEGIRISGAVGDITAETTNGDITLTKVDGKSVDANTVNGDIKYEGTIGPAGRYRFATHNGDITMAIPETSNVTFTVRTYNGEFSAGGMPLKSEGEIRRGRRATYTMGKGGAEVELESFGGTIRLRRPGTVTPRGRQDKPDKQDKQSQHDKSDASATADDRAASADHVSDHSARNATMGSTCAARKAGAAAAATDVSVSTTAIAAKVKGSVGAI
jgi:hypothetical protein